MGYGSPGGAETLLGLLDTPATYSGQALKQLRVNAGATASVFEAATLLKLTDTPSSYSGQGLKLLKVNAGGTACIFGLLLTFADWYAGGAPTTYPWEFEAILPFTPTYEQPFFSPVLKNIQGQYYCYIVSGYKQDFYLYNITTKQYHRLADLTISPSLSASRPLALSPDGTKLACAASNLTQLEIYDIEANTWTASAVAPNLNGTAPQIRGAVWVDDDTIWCIIRANVPGWTVKFYKYVVSTTTWTQFANSITPSQHAAHAMGCNSDGSILYAGNIGVDNSYYAKYVVATDTYSQATLGSQRDFIYCADRTRLWFYFEGSYTCEYFDCKDETTHDIFPANPQRDKPTNWALGVYGLSACIVHHRVNPPRFMSYFGSGSWRLAQKTLTDYNLVVFKKPNDGYSISAVDKLNNYFVPIPLFTTLVLPAGTWEFFYPKDGDYTQLVISGSELK